MVNGGMERGEATNKSFQLLALTSHINQPPTSERVRQIDAAVTMLTASNLGSLDASNRAALLADQPPPRKAKKEITVRIYEDELERPKNLDLGLKGVSRAQLRAWVKECILEASVVKRRKYSHSALSSALSGIDTTGNAKNALKQLQKERLIVSRMGFPDRAMEIDAEIDRMLTKVKQVRDQEEKDLLDYRLKMLAAAQGRKRAKMEAEIAEEFNTLEETLKHEYIKVRLLPGGVRKVQLLTSALPLPLPLVAPVRCGSGKKKSSCV